MSEAPSPYILSPWMYAGGCPWEGTVSRWPASNTSGPSPGVTATSELPTRYWESRGALADSLSAT